MSVIFVGSAGDLPRSLGVEPDAPEVEAALQKVLRACLAHKVACGIPVDSSDIPRRMKEGWKYLDLGRSGSGLSPAADAALRTGRALEK